MNIAIITGVSRGLGESIAKQLLTEEMHVYGISRSENKELHSEKYTYYPCDIGDLKQLEQTLAQINEQISKHVVEKIYVINNAALLTPINHSMAINNDKLTYHIQVNTVAPMIILNNFLNVASSEKAQLIGINITSGAAEKPMYGWSAYCSTKASINMYTKTVALEQEELKNEHKIIAFSPGIMDTDMQVEIRASSKKQFKDVDNFRKFKENNDLNDTRTVSNILLNILKDENNLINGKIYYAYDFI